MFPLLDNIRAFVTVPADGIGKPADQASRFFLSVALEELSLRSHRGLDRQNAKIPKQWI
jgi:hypothetical protein